MSGAVDGEVTALQDRRGGRRAAGQRPHAGDELGEHERLAEVVVRTELQAVHTITGLRGGGEHEDPRAGACKRSAHVVTVDDRQVSVEQLLALGCDAVNRALRPPPDLLDSALFDQPRLAQLAQRVVQRAAGDIYHVAHHVRGAHSNRNFELCLLAWQFLLSLL